MSGLLAAMVVSVWRVMFHRMVTQSFAVAVVGSYSYHHSFTSIPNSLQIVQCMCAAAFLWRCMCTVLDSSEKPVTRWPMVPSKQPHSLHFGSTSVFMSMLDWYQHVGGLWYWAAMIKPAAYTLMPAALSQQWGLSWFTSASFGHCRYLAWSPFDSHFKLICWRPWCLALAFVLLALDVFASYSPGDIAGTLGSRLSFIDCLLMEYKDFLSSWSLTKVRRIFCVSLGIYQDR